MNKMLATLIAVAMCLPASTTSAQLQYNIISLGQPGETASGGQGVSNSGSFAAGFTMFTENDALIWSDAGGTFAVSSNGSIAGSSSINGSVDAMPFLWSESSGMTPIPLPTGTSTGSARGVNADGWVVGTGSGLFAVPFLHDGTDTYRLQDLIPAGSGWDLATGTFNGAFGIANDGTIVGRGLLNGEITGFVLTLVPDQAVLVSSSWDWSSCAFAVPDVRPGAVGYPKEMQPCLPS